MLYPLWLQALLGAAEPAFLQVLGFCIVVLLVGVAFAQRMLTSRCDVLALLGVVIVAAAYRLWFFEPSIFEHGHYASPERMPRLLTLASSALSVLEMPRFNPYRAVFGFNVVLGVLSAPLIAFHTELIFHRRPLSWFSGLLMACHPMHVRLSSSEAPVISSVFIGALIFVAFHLLVTERRARRRWVLALATLGVLPVFLLTRPLNFLLFPVLYVFAWIYRKEVFASLGLTAFVATIFLLNIAFLWALNSTTGMFDPTYSIQIAEGFLSLFFSHKNVLLNPSVVSWGALVLLVLGVWMLARRAPVALGMVLLWYLGTMAITSISLSTTVLGNTKYFLALIYPLLIIAAHAIEAVERRWMQVAVVSLAVTMPFFAAGYLREKLDYQHEYDFIRKIVARLEPGDQVLEIPRPESREGERLKAYYLLYEAFRDVGRSRADVPQFVRSADQIDWSRRVLFFCGVECNNQRIVEGADAPGYQRIFDGFELEPVAESVHPFSLYMFGPSGVPMDLPGRYQPPPGQTIRLGLYRMNRKPGS